MVKIERSKEWWLQMDREEPLVDPSIGQPKSV